MMQFALYLLCTFAQEDIMAPPVNIQEEMKGYFIRMDGFVPARVRPQAPTIEKPEFLELHFADLPIRGCFFKMKFALNRPLGRAIDPW